MVENQCCRGKDKRGCKMARNEDAIEKRDNCVPGIVKVLRMQGGLKGQLTARVLCGSWEKYQWQHRTQWKLNRNIHKEEG